MSEQKTTTTTTTTTTTRMTTIHSYTMDPTIFPQTSQRRQAMRMRHQLGFQRLNQLSFMQIITSCPLFIAGVVTLVMALPHVEYPVFNFGPVFVSILVFPMALIGLLATRKATENVNEIETTGAVRYMIVCNFVLSILCCVLTAASSFYSFYIVEQCSDTSSEYYELCLPNSRANVGLSLVDGVVCLILLLLSFLGIVHFCTHGFKLCFKAGSHKAGVQLTVVLPTRAAGKTTKTAGQSEKAAGHSSLPVVQSVQVASQSVKVVDHSGLTEVHSGMTAGFSGQTAGHSGMSVGISGMTTGHSETMKRSA